MNNPATNPPVFQITSRIASKLKSLESGLALRGFSVQRNDYEIHPYGTINKPFYNFDMAMDALACCKAAYPEREYHIQQFGLDAGHSVRTWQQCIDESEPFERVWYLQHIADCLNAYTLSNPCTSQDYEDASQACFAVADAIEPLLSHFQKDQEAFNDAMMYYAMQASGLHQSAVQTMEVKP